MGDISQHSESLRFNPDPVQQLWVSSRLARLFRRDLEQRYGGVGIEMAGSVGSVETPQVFPAPISQLPSHFHDVSHPAGCRTVFGATGTPAPLGYTGETPALGQAMAKPAVEDAIASGSAWSATDTIWGKRADVCVPLTNLLFDAAGVFGVFSDRAAAIPGCAVTLPALPNGTTVGTAVVTQIAAFRIGDGSFVSLPGEVFPFTYLGSFLGPSDLPHPQALGTPLLMPYLHTPWRFFDGLAEDMVGYIFPAGGGVERSGREPDGSVGHQLDRPFRLLPPSDDSESTSSNAAAALGTAMGEAPRGIAGTHRRRALCPARPPALARSAGNWGDRSYCDINVTFPRIRTGGGDLGGGQRLRRVGRSFGQRRPRACGAAGRLAQPRRAAAGDARPDDPGLDRRLRWASLAGRVS